jgi:hypothetical protein
MDEQNSAGGSSGAEVELPTKWAIERGELQSDVDTFVHQVLAGLLKAAEDLKLRIREETLAEVQRGRRERDAVQREIEAARMELENVRASGRGYGPTNIGREREAILAEARAETERIVEAARKSLLDEIRGLQDQLREIQQVQAQLGHGGGATPTASATISTPEPRQMLDEPTVVHATTAPPTTFGGPIHSQPESAGPRMMQLIFTNVPGYQGAAAIERATRQLPDVSNVDVQEFERGRLVLEVQLGDPSAVADAMVANGPAEMFVTEQSASAITFQLS